MSATDGRPDDVGTVKLAFVDVRVRSLVVGEARRLLLTRVFGVAGKDQSFLVTIVLLGAGGAMLRGLIPRRLLHPSVADAALGGALVNASLRGLAGPPSRNMPLAGALLALALVSHSVRPAVAGTVHGLRRLPREFETVLGVRHR